jgi:translocation and assembly module TamB
VSVRWGRWIRIALLLFAVTALIVFVALESGWVERRMRDAVVQQLGDKTGARVELGGFHLHMLRLRAELDDLTLHGREGAGMAPLLHASRLSVRLHILSFFGGKFAVDELLVERPEVSVQFDKNGNSNLPTPKFDASGRPWPDALFDLQIGKLELRNGSAVVNDRRLPLALRGQNFEFLLKYAARAAGGDSYVGNFQWKQVELASGKDAPFASDISAKFTLHRDAFELDELVWKLPHSELNVRAELSSFSRNDWNLHYRGRLSLADVRTIVREPLTPDAVTDFAGQARYASGEWTAQGHYDCHDIRLPYEWFHASGMGTWGDYEVTKEQLTVPNLSVRALGGLVEGTLVMDLNKLTFRTETRLRGVSLAAALAAVDNKGFPVHTLHWDARMDVDSVNTWKAAFKDFRSKGESRWSPPQIFARGATLPVTARIDYDLDRDKKQILLSASQIATPKSLLEMDGGLSMIDSTLELKIRADDLLEWDDFINILRGADEVPARVGGNITWRGRILGPLDGPTFSGHLHALEARYDRLYWNEIDGDLEYSPDALHLTKTSVRRGKTSALLDLNLTFDHDWGFLPESPWTLQTRLDHAPADDVQAMFETSYPVTGFLTGDFRGSGTRAAPVFDSTFVFEDIMAKGIRFDRLSGELHLAHDEIRLSRAELRKNSGSVAGDVLYRPQELDAEYQLRGVGISLDKIEALQSSSLPIGGMLEFDVKARGPILAPVAKGSLKVTDLHLGSEVQGNVLSDFSSDGRDVHLSVTSNMQHGKLQGELAIGLMGDSPVTGKLSVEQFDMDALIVAGLHLRQLTGHSSVDGVFTISGALRKPDTLEVNADIARIAFDYDLVKLQNVGPIRFTYRRNEVRIDQAHLAGPDTNLTITGSARFDRDRPMRFALEGGVDMRLLAGFVPDLETKGAANINISVEGTMSRPRVTGRVSVHDASANYADFPVGLSHVNGDLVFDNSRLLFDHVTAQSGGGELTLSGNMSYGEGDPRYEISATTSSVRVRYPAGMSWLIGGSMQLTGTSNAATLTGRVEVKRILFAEGVDVASFFAAASQTTLDNSSSSPFLRNLTFDVAGYTNPGARIEWTGAHVDIDGDVHLRGTWDHPVLLGHIHLLGGEMQFRGNNFQLTRGDINFANPFRLDPVLNVEGTARISQYQVTITFSGPASRLGLNYRSDPPLPDSDVIALLALGSTGEESALRSSSAASQNYGATALLSEAISSSFGGSIERLFGISHFRVDPFLSGTATESNAAARVTVEQQVTPDLSIIYSSNASTTNQYQLIQVEYEVRKDLSVVFLRDINGTYAFEVKFVKRFK